MVTHPRLLRLDRGAFEAYYQFYHPITVSEDEGYKYTPN
jgi:hypothetical protein